jgi:sterol desaturase/sphingolipid hydroxylase (fatty acid hydroxylase superfamily)
MVNLLQNIDYAASTAWSHLNIVPENPRLQFTVLLSVVHIIAVYSTAAFFLTLKHFGWFQRYRIQGDKEPDQKLVRKCQTHMIISCLFSFPIVMHFVVYPLARRSVSEISPVPSTSTVLLHLIFFVLCEDCLFYWLHRASHHPIVYAFVHKQHHEFKINHPLCYEYSTIWEGIFVNTGNLELADAYHSAAPLDVIPPQFRLYSRPYSCKLTQLHFPYGCLFA